MKEFTYLEIVKILDTLSLDKCVEIDGVMVAKYRYGYYRVEGQEYSTTMENTATKVFGLISKQRGTTDGE